MQAPFADSACTHMHGVAPEGGYPGRRRQDRQPAAQPDDEHDAPLRAQLVQAAPAARAPGQPGARPGGHQRHRQVDRAEDPRGQAAAQPGPGGRLGRLERRAVLDAWVRAAGSTVSWDEVHTRPPCSSSCSISQSWRTVSTVGTQIALYCASFGMLKREFGSTHVVHWHDLHENLRSYMFESVGGVIDAVLLEYFATS